MIILDEKMPPPPPYAPPTPAALPSQAAAAAAGTEDPAYVYPPPPFPYTTRVPPRLDTLPPHLLLNIVYATFTHTASIKKQRKTLYWLTMNVRLVNKALYVACMHVLRSTYLEAYTSFIRPPYTSDPFPLSSPTASTSSSSASSSPSLPSFSPSSFPPSNPQNDPTSPLQQLHRETRVLDLFIALKVREDVWADESELHLERDESFRDLFDLNQPRARVEDLVGVYGAREGVVSLGIGVSSGSVSGSGSGIAKKRAPQTPTSQSQPSRNRVNLTPIPFSALCISFATRRVGLVLTTRDRRRRTIVEVERRREDRLEDVARRLVRELGVYIREGGGA